MKKLSTKFYIIRHGESVANTLPLYGDSDTHLTEKGKAQAHKVGKSLKNITFHRLYSSHLIRAKHTAEIINSYIHTEHVIEKEIQERIYGSLSGKRIDEVENEFKELYESFSTMTDEEIFSYRMTPDQETNKETAQRLRVFLNKKAETHKGQTIAVVCHGNIMRAFLVLVGYGTFKHLPSGSVDNTGCVVIEHTKNTLQVLSVSGVHKKEVIGK